MVLLASAICSKEGKVLISRQYVEMSKSRIEGLIATFPKLVDPGKQHTFVETDSVRFVYQPLEKMYVLLITTKASNILEDLETLRLFARVIPEYARGTDVSDVVENAFQLIFAFDEIVSLSYRESVNLSQIRTFTEMDSHEEKVINALQENQIKAAKETANKKARELQQARLAAAKQGLSPAAAYSSFGKMDSHRSHAMVDPRTETADDSSDVTQPFLTQQQKPAPIRRGMQLGSRSGGGFANKAEMEQLTDMIRSEAPSLPSAPKSASGRSAAVPNAAPTAIESLHIRMEEKIAVQAGRDGNVESMEVSGVMFVRASDEEASRARILVDTREAVSGSPRRPPTSLQTHPNLDKKVFQSSGWLQIKPGGKLFPTGGQEVGVLKWRCQSQEEQHLPITVNCWPTEIAGGFEVNIEYELQDTSLQLVDFCVTIPLPQSSAAPLVGNCDGDYEMDARRGQLLWTQSIVDADNTSGSLDFTIKTTNKNDAAFFPVQVNFTSNAGSYCGIKVTDATNSDETQMKFSIEHSFAPSNYAIV